MAHARNERNRLAAAFETTEKTAPGSGYFYVDHMSNTLARREGLLEDDILGNRDPGDADLDSPVVDGEIGVPIDVEGSGFWLKALFGAPATTEDTGVYTHVYESGAWDLPSLSMERQVPDVPSYEMFLGVKADKLRIDMQRSGRVNGTVSVIGQGSNTPTAITNAGTPTARTLSRFMQKEGVAKIGGTPVGDLVSASFEYANNLDPVDTVTGDGFIGGLDPMRAAMSGTIKLRFDSETHFAAAKAGTAQSLSFEWTKSASSSLVLAMPRVFLSVPGRSWEGPGGTEAEFQFQAARASNGDPMVTATLVNEVGAY